MKKYFLISIDTEGDNLWDWENGKIITTNNTHYLSRFQMLCEKYNFKPTYLTNYEMAMDDDFVDFAKNCLNRNMCEIGMHLHAWNSPPEYDLEKRTIGEAGAPYLIEYPTDIMEKKINFMTDIIKERFGVKPITHRAGRWAMNEEYFKLISNYGYIADCTVTPGMSWKHANGYSEKSCGVDYTKYPIRPYIENGTNVLEIPMTVRENHRIYKNPGEGIKKWLRNHTRAIKGQGKIWLRPSGKNLDDLIYLVNKVSNNRKDDYIMFMLHSSELMPKGSPRFDSVDAIEKLYEDLEVLFKVISAKFEGITIGDYTKIKKREHQ